MRFTRVTVSFGLFVLLHSAPLHKEEDASEVLAADGNTTLVTSRNCDQGSWIRRDTPLDRYIIHGEPSGLFQQPFQQRRKYQQEET